MPREADLRYQPKCKDLKDAMSWIKKNPTKEERELALKIINNIIIDDDDRRQETE